MSFLKNKIVALSVLAIVSFSTIGCGYILYPNRRNRIARGGNIDVAVVIMDILWLIPGIVPGVIALVWDGIHGSWYTSGGSTILKNPNPKPLQMQANRQFTIRGPAVGNALAVSIEDASRRTHQLTPVADRRGNHTLRVPVSVATGPGRLLLSSDGQPLHPIPILID